MYYCQLDVAMLITCSLLFEVSSQFLICQPQNLSGQYLLQSLLYYSFCWWLDLSLLAWPLLSSLMLLVISLTHLFLAAGFCHSQLSSFLLSLASRFSHITSPFCFFCCLSEDFRLKDLFALKHVDIALESLIEERDKTKKWKL